METAANKPSSRSPHGAAPLDVQQLEQLREVSGREGGTLLDELVAMVVRDVPPELEHLKILVRQRSGAPLAQLAHRVAGTAASLGAVTLRQVLHELEQAGRQADWPAADRISAALDDVWEITRAALQKISHLPPP